MEGYSAEEVQEALRPIASLISKSKKAQQKVAAGTWQHTMLGVNLKALRMASGLITGDAGQTLTRDDLEEALRAVGSMIDRTEGTRTKFAPGTSQHTLQRNRLKALRVAEAAIRAEMDRG